MSGLTMALLAVLVVGAAWGHYWPRIKAMRVPPSPVAYQAAMLAGIVLALLAFGRSPGLLGGAMATLALLGGCFFLFGSFTSKLSVKPPAVAPGEPALDFQATDSDGNSFSLSALRGSPVLLKFFRGHW